MKKLLFSLLLLGLVAAGCAVTNYPVLTDNRGDFSGIIRTGHKAYIVPTSQIATIWPDGSDELFTMVFQNQYGDQKLYTFNNLDPTATVLFVDQQYCDWQYSGCEIARGWNPAPPRPDDPFDYEYFPNCSGARSLSLLLDQGSRLGECGDGNFNSHKQQLYGTFANLATTTWRGETAYVLPIDASNTNVTLNNTTVPLFGSYTGFITEDLKLVLPMTPNVRNNLRWLSGFVSENGPRANVNFDYNGLVANVDVFFAAAGLQYNQGRM